MGVFIFYIFPPMEWVRIFLSFPGLVRVVCGAGAAYRWSRQFALLELNLRVTVGLNITIRLRSDPERNDADA